MTNQAIAEKLKPRPTIWCNEGKHDECKGWGETIFDPPRVVVQCNCPCHEQNRHD